MGKTSSGEVPMIFVHPNRILEFEGADLVSVVMRDPMQRDHELPRDHIEHFSEPRTVQVRLSDVVWAVLEERGILEKIQEMTK